MPLRQKSPVPDLRPGDFLFYHAKGWWDVASQLTMRRTAWGYAVHVEVYHRNGLSTASRNGIGVNLYPFRKEQLLSVRRSPISWDYDQAFSWFTHVARGQEYDWLGLLCFTYAVKQGSPHKMFCSEYATRFARHGNLRIIRAQMDADTVSPNALEATPALNDIWRLK